MALDQVAVRSDTWKSYCFNVGADAVKHQLLDLGRRHARHAASFVLPVLQERMGYIVAVTHPQLVRVGRAHAIATIIENAAGQNAGRVPESDFPSNRIGGKLGLHRLEQVAVEDRLMLSGVNLAPVHYLAKVEPVRQGRGTVALP